MKNSVLHVVFSIIIFLIMLISACGTSQEENDNKNIVSAKISPTKTPPPYTTPIKTPTLQITELEVKVGRDYIADERFYIVGEVVNKNDKWFNFVKVLATFYDESNKVIATDRQFASMEELAPNDTIVFKLMSDVGGRVSAVHSYKLQVDGEPTQDIPYQDLVINIGQGYESYDYYHIPGEVINTGQIICKWIEIVFGFYNSEGKVIGVDNTFSDLDEIPSGGSSPFELVVSSTELDEPFNSYRTWVSCYPLS